MVFRAGTACDEQGDWRVRALGDGECACSDSCARQRASLLTQRWVR